MRLKSVLAVTSAAALLGALAPATGSTAATAASGGDLHGVVRAAGAAVSAPVTVGWYQPDTGTERTVRTAADGTFSLPLPAAGARYVVFAGLAHASGEPEPQLPHTLGAYYGTNGRAFEFQSRTRFTAGSTARAPLALDLAAATPITGSLPALARRRVYLVNRAGDEVGETETDATGAFRVEVVPGAYRVEVDGDATYLDYRSPVLTVRDGVPRVLTVALRVGAVVTGVVRSDGRPVAGVRVTTNAAGADSTTTAADGTYRLSALRPGTHRIRFSAIGTAEEHTAYVPVVQEVTGLALGSTTRVDASVRRGARIVGSFAAGSRAKRYTVLISPAAGGTVTGYFGTAQATSSKNPVVVSGLTPGAYLLRVVAQDGATYARRLVTVRAGATARLGTLRPTLRTLTMSGSVGTGTGVVAALNRNGWTGGFATVSSGRYRVSGLIPGVYSVVSRAGTRVAATTTVTLARSIRRDLPVGTRPGTLRGRVQVNGVDLVEGSLLTGEGADGVPSLLGRLDSEITRGVLRGSGAAGRHEILALDLWDRPFQANSPYSLTWPAGWVTLRAGRTTDVGTVQLDLEG